MSEFLTVDETADLLRTTPGAIYTSRHRSEPPGIFAVKVGRKLLFRRSDIDAYFTEQLRVQRDSVPAAP